MTVADPWLAGLPAPQPPLRFSRRRFHGVSLLRSHVIKHIVEARDERWHELVPMSEIDVARDPTANPALRAANLDLLDARYENLAWTLVVERMLANREAAAWIHTTVEGMIRWTVAAWDEGRRLWALAVQDEDLGEDDPRYRLTTCFRLEIVSKQDFGRHRFRHWAADRVARGGSWPRRLAYCAPGPVSDILGLSGTPVVKTTAHAGHRTPAGRHP